MEELNHSKEKKKSSKFDLFPLILILIINSFLVLSTITLRSMWLDEAYSYRLTSYTISALIKSTSLDVHPPFYYILLNLYYKKKSNTLILIVSLF